MFDVTLAAHLAALSKLHFTEEELRCITEEMDAIVSLMDTVADCPDTAADATMPPASLEMLRADQTTPSMEREAALANAKEKTETFFQVPKVV